MSGFMGGYLRHCEKDSIREDKWTVITPMPNKKLQASACIFNHKYIYVIGGEEADKHHAVIDKVKPVDVNGSIFFVEKYNITNNRWKTIQLSSDSSKAQSAEDILAH